MVYQNRAGQGTRTTNTAGSVRPPPVITSQSRSETYQRESLRVPVTRRIVSVPGSSHGSPAVGLGIFTRNSLYFLSHNLFICACGSLLIAILSLERL